jgi:hypothetical protein
LRTLRNIKSGGFIKQITTITSAVDEVHVFDNSYLVVSIVKVNTTLAATYSSLMPAASNAQLIDENVTNENLSFYKTIVMFQLGSQLFTLLQKTGPNPELSQEFSEEEGIVFTKLENVLHSKDST